MKCINCNTELSAGDISILSMKDNKPTWGVVCRECDTTQPAIVSEVSGGFRVIVDTEKGE